MIETPRLRLKPIFLEDAEFVFEIVNTKEYINNIGQRNVTSTAVAEIYIQDKMIDHYTIHGYGNYVMIRIEDGVKVGCVSLYNREDMEGIDIGFALLPAYFGLGYAYEGAEALKQYALNQLDIKSICAITSKDNIPSQKLIKKLGLTFEKTILFGEEQEELLYYSLG